MFISSTIAGIWAVIFFLFFFNVMKIKNAFGAGMLTVAIVALSFLLSNFVCLPESLTPQILVVLSLLAFTVFLFAFEVVRVDIAAVIVMLVLGLLSFLPGLDTLANPEKLFNGFASNAVISIIAVIIIGAGLDKTGAMHVVARFILRLGGKSENRIQAVISATVGTISSFMQNIGAAALFLPVIRRIANRTGIPISRLLMPMGFSAILGGTITMVGSSPLILLNDLIKSSNTVLPPEQQMETISMFTVTPIGLALLAAGIVYFMIAGRFILPASQGQENKDTGDYFHNTYGWEGDIREITVIHDSVLVDKTVLEIEKEYNVHVIAVAHAGTSLIVAPQRDMKIKAETVLGIMAKDSTLVAFSEKTGLTVKNLEFLEEALSSAKAGIAEIVIPPSSAHIGKTMADIRIRANYGLNALTVSRVGENHHENLRDWEFKAGDTLMAHTSWENLHYLEQNKDFTVITSDYPYEELRPHKLGFAIVFFALALGLILFTDIRLSIALLTGAIGMILTRVLSMDEAYRAVDWKTVFLLASLIPLGVAVNDTGTAKWIADSTLSILGDVPIWVLQTAVAILATVFSLVMSNVGATVLLVPLAVNIAIGAGANPMIFALIVGLATSNSFILPTHQVNALLMGPGGYRVADFMKAGGIMTILFLVVMLVMLNIVF